MERKIAITNDLAEVFVTCSLNENYCDFIDGKHNKERYNYQLRKLADLRINFEDSFSALSHLLLLYDQIELPTMHPIYTLHGDISSIAEIRGDEDSVLFGISFLPLPLELYYPKENAANIRPLVINACMKKPVPPYLNKYAIETKGSVENLYCYMYDRRHKRNDFSRNNRIEFDLQADDKIWQRRLSEVNSDEYSACLANEYVHQVLFELLQIRKIAQEEPCDFYTPLFSNFHSEINLNDAYCILKNQISMIMDEQPAFDSLTEILRFRESRHRDIKLLRDEVSALDTLLVQGEREQAIQKAIQDVRSANQSLIKNTVAKKTARIATYLSVPISLLELYTFGTSYSIAIGAVGTTAQFIADRSDSKNNWLFVAR